MREADGPPAATTVGEIGERALVARITSRLTVVRADIHVGLGDDAAVVAIGRNEQLVLTTDAVVESVHFRLGWSSPADVGWKALAVNLSDLAAMGAEPKWGLLSLGLPERMLVRDVDDLVAGVAELATAHRMAVVGGNVTRSPGPLIVDVTAAGTVRPRRVLTRGGGRPGDVLLLSGSIGAAAAGLEILRASEARDHPSLEAPGELAQSSCPGRHRRPEPRVRLGVAIGRNRAARAAMDLSDGLADAVQQVAEASGCGAVIDASALPIDPDAQQWWQSAGRDPVSEAVRGGDDYELLIAVPPKWMGRLRAVRQRVSVPLLQPIGQLTATPGELLLDRDGTLTPLPRGFEHFPC